MRFPPVAKYLWQINDVIDRFFLFCDFSLSFIKD